MGNIGVQQKLFETRANIKKTWQDLLSEANIQGEARDRPLTGNELENALHPVTMLIVFIYQMENWCYVELNRACRFKNPSKLQTLGPWALALSEIVWRAQYLRKDKTKYDCHKL